MARFSFGERMGAAPTSTLPGMSLYAPAGNGFSLRELWIFNTTTTACQVALRRATTAGTQGTAITEMEWHEDGIAPTATGFQNHSVGPTLATGNLMLGDVGAAIGAAIVWSFGDSGIVVAPGTGNGLCITTPTGTGQVCDVVWVWDE